MKIKKIIKYIIILLIIALIIGTIVYFIKRNKKPVSVYSLNEITMDNYWQDDNSSEGSVSEDKMQSVYVSATQQVEKIAVKEGQKVKKGDILLKYNTTLTNIELERKQIDVSKLELDLSRAQNELSKIQTYQPNVPIYGSLPVEQPVEEPKIHTELPNLTAPVPTVEKSKEISPAPLTGSGTKDSPYLFIWSDGKEYDKTFIQNLIKRAGDTKTEVYAVFMIRENSSLSGNLIKATEIKFIKKDEDFSFSILSMDSDFDPLYPNGQEEEIVAEDTPIPEVGPIYTATEIQKMIIDKEKEISEITLNIKIAKNEYKKLQSELENTTIYSNIDGVVKSVLSIDDENLSTKPIIVVSGGGGYYIQGRVSELNLDKVKVGQTVNVQSYESGTFAEGTIESISNYPVQNSYYYGTGNSNVSYYPYVVKVGDDVTFKEGEFVMLNVVSEVEVSNTFFVPSAFVRTENGKTFAYIAGEDGKLEKRDLVTGKNMHGMIEIYSGITRDERIAFPYGKTVKEGANTVEASMEELYMGM